MTVPATKYQDNMSEEVKSAYFDLPALDVSVAFPQATPASIFLPSVSDYYQFDDLLTLEEQAVRKRVRECMEKEVAPTMAKYWEKAEFPFEVVPKLGALSVAGSTIKVLKLEVSISSFWAAMGTNLWHLTKCIIQGYGCPGLSITASVIATAELARVDASCSTSILVHSCLAMLTIGRDSVWIRRTEAEIFAISCEASGYRMLVTGACVQWNLGPDGT